MSIFNDTQLAFSLKSNFELKKAYLLFKSIQNPTLSNLGINFLQFSIKNNLPGVDFIIKNTMYTQFCGGETREKAVPIVEKLYEHHVSSIFDYAKEGAETEESFWETFREIITNIEFASKRKEIPFVVFKPTGFGRIDLYELVGKKKPLTATEKQEWERVKSRYEEVCKLAHKLQVPVMIDAEESWMQDAADDLAREMMQKYNKEKPIVWNTVQFYRTDRLDWIQTEIAQAKEMGYFLGYKFVRGAYMEKERNRATIMGYASPIMPTKEATDDQYNAAAELALDHKDILSVYYGTHNERSTELIINKMEVMNVAPHSSKIFFGQLYGMSDNITFYLGNAGYNATKYLPYGKLQDVIPYLTRRAKENTSVAGQTGRELGLIATEMKRRNISIL